MINYDSSPPSITYTDNDGQNTAVATHTFTSKAIGAAHPSRRVVVAVGFYAATTSCTMTIAGVAATELTGCARNYLGSTRTRMFIADIPTGTTATIVVTLGAAGACYIGVFSLLNALSATPVATSNDDTSPVTLDLNVSANGVACGYAIINVSTTWAWTGMTEAFDATISSLTHTGATYTATAAQSPLSVSASVVPAGAIIGCAASFR